MSVWRAEIRVFLLTIFAALGDILCVVAPGSFKQLDVVESVVADGVSFFDDAVEYVGMFSDVVADAEECRLDAVRGE